MSDETEAIVPTREDVEESYVGGPRDAMEIQENQPDTTTSPTDAKEPQATESARPEDSPSK